MNLRHVRAFVAIADRGGFARAAASLHLSQPALSRQILALEAEWNVPLFHRMGRRVQLTSEGEDMLRHCRRLLVEADSLGERARQLKAGETGILRVGGSPQLIERLLAEFLPHYARRHPGIEVHLLEDGGAQMSRRLEQGDVHLACMPAGDTNFESRPLFPIYVLAVLSPAHRLARRATLDVSELQDEPLLLLRREFGSRTWFDAASGAALIRPRVILESAAPHTLVALAATGHGIAILPSNAEVPTDSVRARPLMQRGASIGRWAHIAWSPQRFLAPYAKQFVTELAAHCARDYPGRDLIRRAAPLPRG